MTDENPSFASKKRDKRGEHPFFLTADHQVFHIRADDDEILIRVKKDSERSLRQTLKDALAAIDSGTAAVWLVED